MNHPFIDGNKRTGMTSAAVFLENNGYVVTSLEGEIEGFALRVVTEKLGMEVISAWLKKHSKKIKRT